MSETRLGSLVHFVLITFSLVSNLKLCQFSFVFTVVTSVNDEDYMSLHWPKLEGAIQLILQQNPGEFIPISYEEMYRYIFKFARVLVYSFVTSLFLEWFGFLVSPHTYWLFNLQLIFVHPRFVIEDIC